MRLHPDDRIAQYTSEGWWTDDTWDSLLRSHAVNRPDDIAVVDAANRQAFMDGEPRRHSWRSLDQSVDRVAAGLQAAGVGPDDVVGIQLPNSVELVEALLATARVGAIATPFPVQFREYELEQLGNLAKMVAFVTVPRVLDRANAEAAVKLQASVPGLRSVLVFGDDPPEGAVALRANDAGSPEPTSIDPAGCVTICWTSGTESTPKGVPRTHQDWGAIARASVDGARITSADVMLNPFPMVNMAGIGGMLVPWLLTGSRLVQHHPFDLPTFLQQIALERVTYTVAPPALLTMLLAREEILAKADLSSIRVIGSGSAPLSPAMVAGWKEKHGIDVTNFFGSNEGIALLSDPETVPDPEERARFFPRMGSGSFTWPNSVAEGMRTRLVDLESGEEITEANRPGELCIAGPTVFPGYLAGTGPANPFDEEGYFHTGDVFELAGVDGEEPRYYRYVDRAKDLIIRGGMNISPAELEALIQGHPKVADVAVVGVSDDTLGERTAAVVVASDPADPPSLEDIVGLLREARIASYKLPEHIAVVASLPRNPVGKVLKRELRERLVEEGVS